MAGNLIGRRLGNYRIDGVLGKGGMSVMYRATDIRLGRKVALKVISETLGADAEFRERFVDEARNTSAIDHANVVPLYDFGEIDGMLYLAMRLVDGADMATLLNNGSMAPDRAIRLLDQVADALDSLHQRGFIHLDVKPANVLVTSRESVREHVYLADFGLTRRGATGHRTRGGDFLGSPTYAAPEHLRGEPLDGRTDQYALACVLYVCLTGRPPFPGDVSTVIKGHLGSHPPTVSQVVSVPPALDEVLRKGMAKNPKERYASCGEFIAAARRALGPLAMSGTPIEGKTAGPRPVDSASRRNPQSTDANPTTPVGPQQASSQTMSSHTPPPPAGPMHAGPQPVPPPQTRSQFAGNQPHIPPHGQAGFAPPGFAPHTDNPMRLRPPAPADSSTAFSRNNSLSYRWLWIMAGLVVLVGLIIVGVLVFSEDPVPPPNPPAPEIQVGPGNLPSSAQNSGNQLPPTRIPIQPSQTQPTVPPA